jgi:branched-subunit amino acid transport protein
LKDATPRMDELTIWLLIVGLTLVTIGTRSSFLVLGERYPLPERVQHALRYAPACALTALITPEIFLYDGALDLANRAPQLVAGLAAALAMLTLRSMIAAMAIGMVLFTAMRFLA